MTVASNLSLSIKMSQPIIIVTHKADFPDFLTSWFPLGELETGEGQLRDPTQATQALQADKSRDPAAQALASGRPGFPAEPGCSPTSLSHLTLRLAHLTLTAADPCPDLFLTETHLHTKDSSQEAPSRRILMSNAFTRLTERLRLVTRSVSP